MTETAIIDSSGVFIQVTDECYALSCERCYWDAVEYTNVDASRRGENHMRSVHNENDVILKYGGSSYGPDFVPATSRI